MNDSEIKPGMILLEKRYNCIKRLIYRVLGKDLPFNSLCLTLGKLIHDNKGIWYAPKKDYSKVEIAKLELLLDDASLSAVEIINLIRPKTIVNVDTFKVDDITKNKYYKVIDGKETKHISGTRK